MSRLTRDFLFQNGFMPVGYSSGAHISITNCTDFFKPISLDYKMRVYRDGYRWYSSIEYLRGDLLEILNTQYTPSKEVVKIYMDTVANVNQYRGSTKLWDLHKEKLCALYLIQCDGYTKIGISESPESRLYSIENSNPYWCKMIRCYGIINRRYCAGIEKELHDRFKHKNKKLEWFLLEESDISYIDSFMDDNGEKLAW